MILGVSANMFPSQHISAVTLQTGLSDPATVSKFVPSSNIQHLLRLVQMSTEKGPFLSNWIWTSRDANGLRLEDWQSSRAVLLKKKKSVYSTLVYVYAIFKCFFV